MVTTILLIFIVGYIAIAFEHSIKLDKAASALITGVLCWVVYIVLTPDSHLVNEQLVEHLGDVSSVLFFLMGAMTIVELIDAHDGFDFINSVITTTSKKKLIWIIGFITFFLSAMLDNLTTTIVIVSLLRKLIKNANDRLLFVGVVVIAANAGGAWSPIGDVTTTMLWIGGQISTGNIIMKLFLPSLACLMVPLLYISFRLKGKSEKPSAQAANNESPITRRHQMIILFSGVGVLLMVPVFKTLTHLPPFMGIMLGLGLLWIVTVILHRARKPEHKSIYSVSRALQSIDMPSVLFFLGILLAVSALQSTGILTGLADTLTKSIGDMNVIVIMIGLLSSVVDNVPLVAAAQGMYDLSVYPLDHSFWTFLAYSAGTGGSALIIGSAAGVVAMGMEKITFGWYLKRITLLALLGFFSGCIIYILQEQFFF